MRISGRMEFHGQLLAQGHLPEIRKIGADDGDAVSTGKMSHAATARRRGIGHHRDTGALKEGFQSFFRDVPAKFNSWVSSALSLNGFGITGSLWMVATRNDQLHIRHLLR